MARFSQLRELNQRCQLRGLSYGLDILTLSPILRKGRGRLKIPGIQTLRRVTVDSEVPVNVRTASLNSRCDTSGKYQEIEIRSPQEANGHLRTRGRSISSWLRGKRRTCGRQDDTRASDSVGQGCLSRNQSANYSTE